MADNKAQASQAFNRSLETYIYMRSMRDIVITQEIERTSIDFLSIDGDSTGTTFLTATSLPILGRVAAGIPDEKSQTDIPEMRRVVPPPEGADFLLHVIGDSMIDAGIHEGDLLFVKNDESPKDGDIVVAHIEGEGQTVKYLRLKDTPYLEPANANYKPIPLSEETRIQGKVTGLLRDI